MPAQGTTAASSARTPGRHASNARWVLNVVGDVAWPDGWGGIKDIDAAGPDLFALVRPILSGGDLNFANLECPFTTARAVIKKTYPITCHPRRLAYAVDGGPFNLFSLANNHALDAGGQGIDDTLALMRETTAAERPIWWAGVGADQAEAGAPVTVEVPGKGVRLAMIALANGGPATRVGSLHAPDLLERISAAAASHDVVMVSVHFGPEYVHTPSAATVDRFHGFIDAGADLVVAHHAHVVQGVERYGDGFIFYNLGNFSFGSKTRRHFETGARLYSMIGRVEFQGARLAAVELVPVYANNSAAWTLGDDTLPARHAMPQPLYGPFADYALDEFVSFSKAVPTAQPTPLHRVGDRLFADLGGGAPAAEPFAIALHEQVHHRDGLQRAGGGTRSATDGEKKRTTLAGTPPNAQKLAAARKAQKQREAKRKAKRRARQRRLRRNR